MRAMQPYRILQSNRDSRSIRLRYLETVNSIGGTGRRNSNRLFATSGSEVEHRKGIAKSPGAFFASCDRMMFVRVSATSTAHYGQEIA